MTVEQRLHDLEEQITSQKLVIDTLLQNLLNPALMVPGTLRFGGNAMQLDQHGIQIQTPTPATAEVPGVYWTNRLGQTPGDDDPLVTLAGRADPSTSIVPTGIFTFKLRAENGERFGQVSHSVSAIGTNQLALALWNRTSASAGNEATFTLNDTGTSAWFQFNNGDYIRLMAQPLLLGRFTSDPTYHDGGQIWFDSDDQKFRGYDGSAAANFLLEGDVSGMNKVTGSGYLVHPAAATGIDPGNSGSAWTSGSWAEVVASTAQAQSIIGIIYGWDGMADNTRVEAEIDIGTGAAAAETAVATIPCQKQQHHATGGSSASGVNSIDHRPLFFPAPIEIATSTRIAVRVRSSSTTIEPADIKLIYVKTSELVAR